MQNIYSRFENQHHRKNRLFFAMQKNKTIHEMRLQA
jgi:hypothetical protein